MATLPPPIAGTMAAPEAAGLAAEGPLLPLGLVANAVGPQFATTVENLWRQHITNVESAEFQTLIKGFPSAADFANNADLRELASKYPLIIPVAKDADFMKAGNNVAAE